MQSDLEIALALQLEEGTIAAQESDAAAAHGVATERAQDAAAYQPGRWLYVVEPCMAPVRCRACGEQVPRQAPRVLFRLLGHRRLTSAHAGCLPAIPGLGPAAQPREGALLSGHLADADRAVVEVQLAELPEGPAGIQGFDWPPPPRPPSRRVELRHQLLSTDRDFTPEDYEALLELDRDQSRGERASAAEQARGLLGRLPVSTLTQSSSEAQCSICLDAMSAGAEVRTLPCMHVFHRKCIDQWLMTPGPPRCPIDQQRVDA